MRYVTNAPFFFFFFFCFFFFLFCRPPPNFARTAAELTPMTSDSEAPSLKNAVAAVDNKTTPRRSSADSCGFGTDREGFDFFDFDFVFDRKASKRRLSSNGWSRALIGRAISSRTITETSIRIDALSKSQTEPSTSLPNVLAGDKVCEVSLFFFYQVRFGFQVIKGPLFGVKKNPETAHQSLSRTTLDFSLGRRDVPGSPVRLPFRGKGTFNLNSPGGQRYDHDFAVWLIKRETEPLKDLWAFIICPFRMRASENILRPSISSPTQLMKPKKIRFAEISLRSRNINLVWPLFWEEP